MSAEEMRQRVEWSHLLTLVATFSPYWAGRSPWRKLSTLGRWERAGSFLALSRGHHAEYPCATRHGGLHSKDIEMMMDDMRAQPIAHGMSLRLFFETLPNRLRNFTLAIPVLLDEEVDPHE